LEKIGKKASNDYDCHFYRTQSVGFFDGWISMNMALREWNNSSECGICQEKMKEYWPHPDPRDQNEIEKFGKNTLSIKSKPMTINSYPLLGL